MDAGNWFWIIYVLSFFFGGGFFYIGRPGDSNNWAYGGWLGTCTLFYVLIGLLGYRVFHSPLQ